MNILNLPLFFIIKDFKLKIEPTGFLATRILAIAFLIFIIQRIIWNIYIRKRPLLNDDFFRKKLLKRHYFCDILEGFVFSLLFTSLITEITYSQTLVTPEDQIWNFIFSNIFPYLFIFFILKFSLFYLFKFFSNSILLKYTYILNLKSFNIINLEFMVYFILLVLFQNQKLYLNYLIILLILIEFSRYFLKTFWEIMFERSIYKNSVLIYFCTDFIITSFLIILPIYEMYF